MRIVTVTQTTRNAPNSIACFTGGAILFSTPGAHLRRRDSHMATEDVGEVAVAGIAELERQLREIDIAIAQPLDSHLHAQRMPIAGERLAGEAAKCAAEPPRRAVHRSRELADGDVALEVAGDGLLRLLHERAGLAHIPLDAPGVAKVSPGNNARAREVFEGP